MTNHMIFGKRLGDHCALPFQWVLTNIPTAHCTDLPVVSGGIAIRDGGGNPLVTQEKHLLPARRGCVSFRTQG